RLESPAEIEAPAGDNQRERRRHSCPGGNPLAARFIGRTDNEPAEEKTGPKEPERQKPDSRPSCQTGVFHRCVSSSCLAIYSGADLFYSENRIAQPVCVIFTSHS